MTSEPLPYARRLLTGFALLTAVSTWVLIWIGGLVTSKGVGMAVPDWPTTYGYNMFLFPFDQWTGGIFHEHLHRLVASGVGLLTLGLAVLVQWREPRRRVRWAAWFAFLLVCVQGFLGGKLVLLNAVDVLGIPGSLFFGVLHATTAQLFFCLVVVIALSVSRWGRSAALAGAVPPAMRPLLLVVFGVTLVQLLVAASMRHQHAGLAIPDFPLAYGKLYPPTDPEFLREVNARRTDFLHDEPVTALHVHLQMLHRGLAVALVGLVGRAAFLLFRSGRPGRWMGGLWGTLLTMQFLLGAVTIWSRKAADVATAHVAVGALLLVMGAVAVFLATVAARQETGKVAPCPSPGESLKARAAQAAIPVA